MKDVEKMAESGGSSTADGLHALIIGLCGCTSLMTPREMMGLVESTAGFPQDTKSPFS